MNEFTLLFIALVAIIVVGFIIYMVGRNSDVTSSQSLNYLSQPPTNLYTGNRNPVFSSDAIERIIYLKDTGTWEYNTKTGEDRLLSEKIPKGLAFDGTYFMMIDDQGTLHQIDEQGNVQATNESGYTKLYDTENGYLIESPAGTTISGSSSSTTKNRGNYGLINLLVR